MARIRIAALGAALMIASAAAGAQSPQDNRPSAEGRGARGHGGRDGQGRAGKALLKGITLSENQKAQIKQIRAKYRDQFQAQREQRPTGQLSDSTRSVRRAQMQHALQQEMNEIRGVLTVDQRVRFDSNVESMKARMQEHAQDQDAKKGKKGGRGTRGR